jgi:hypothetical protein
MGCAARDKGQTARVDDAGGGFRVCWHKEALFSAKRVDGTARQGRITAEKPVCLKGAWFTGHRPVSHPHSRAAKRRWCVKRKRARHTCINLCIRRKGKGRMTLLPNHPLPAPNKRAEKTFSGVD